MSQAVIVPAAGATNLSFRLSVGSGETSTSPVDLPSVTAVVDGVPKPPATFSYPSKGTLGQYPSYNIPLAVATGHSVSLR